MEENKNLQNENQELSTEKTSGSALGDHFHAEGELSGKSNEEPLEHGPGPIEPEETLGDDDAPVKTPPEELRDGNPEELDGPKEPEEIKELPGEDNQPPLEMTEKLKEEILDKVGVEDTYIQKVRSQSQHFGNGKNDWKLINKTFNNALDYNFTTFAMKVGTRGVVVCTIEALNAKTNMSTVYIDNGKLEEEVIDGETKWVLK